MCSVYVQEAQAGGLQIGSGLGLGGDPESGLPNSAAQVRALTGRGLGSSTESNLRSEIAG